MAETIEKCFLIDENEYNTFDSIIKVINQKNQVVSLIALGVKKILSKNSRNLQYGKVLEIEYFKSRRNDSLSKLKRVKVLDINESYNIIEKDYLILLNQFISKNLLKFNYLKYKEIIKYSSKYSNDTMMIYILWIILNVSGLYINLSMCSICNSKKIKTISIAKQGYLCQECSINNNEYVHETEFNKIFIKLKNENLEAIEEFNQKEALIKFLRFYVRINGGIKI